MVLISNSFPGRSDGNYSIIFGDADIGSLISAIHATSIKIGNELEHIIIEMVTVIDNTNLDAFFNKTLPVGIYVIPKKTLRDKRLRFDQIPDMLVVNVSKNTCKIIEIKLGDNFDTKKSAGEVENLKRYAEKLDRATTYRVSWAVCMWYSKDKASVVTGFKNKITEVEALTGYDFCSMVGIDYNLINARISEHQSENREYLFSSILNIQKCQKRNILPLPEYQQTL